MVFKPVRGKQSYYPKSVQITTSLCMLCWPTICTVGWYQKPIFFIKSFILEITKLNIIFIEECKTLFQRFFLTRIDQRHSCQCTCKYCKGLVSCSDILPWILWQNGMKIFFKQALEQYIWAAQIYPSSYKRLVE